MVNDKKEKYKNIRYIPRSKVTHNLRTGTLFCELYKTCRHIGIHRLNIAPCSKDVKSAKEIVIHIVSKKHVFNVLQKF